MYSDIRPFTREIDTLSGKATLSKLFYLPSDKRSNLKEKNIWCWCPCDTFLSRQDLVSQ